MNKRDTILGLLKGSKGEIQKTIRAVFEEIKATCFK